MNLSYDERALVRLMLLRVENHPHNDGRDLARMKELYDRLLAYERPRASYGSPEIADGGRNR